MPRSILFVAHSPNFAGAEYSLLRLIRGLSPAQWSPRILAPAGGRFEQEVRALNLPFHGFEPARPHRFKTDGRVGLADALSRCLLNVDRYFEKIPPPDIIHSNTFHVWEGALLAARWKVPHVWNLREILRDSPTWEPYVDYKALCQVMARLSDSLICVSQALADSLPAVDTPVEVVHNGLDSRELASRRESREFFKKNFGISDDEKVFLTVGNFIPDKGHAAILPYLANFMQQVPNARFLWPGSHHFCYADIRSKLDAMGLAERVLTPGHIDDFGRWMAGADLYLLLSETEAFPTVVLEALRAGVPTLARDCGGVREILETCGGKLVPREDMNAFVHSLAEYARGDLTLDLTNPESFKESAMVQKYVAIYARVLTSNSARHPARAVIDQGLQAFRAEAGRMESARIRRENRERHPVARRVLRLFDRWGW